MDELSTRVKQLEDEVGRRKRPIHALKVGFLELARLLLKEASLSEDVRKNIRNLGEWVDSECRNI